MELTVISMLAAHSGQHNPVWHGNIDVPDNIKTNDEVNEYIFEVFNRLTAEDTAWLEQVGYHMPSLSVGDFIIHNERCWQVARFGFNTSSDYMLKTA